MSVEKCKYLNEDGSCGVSHLEPSMATPPIVVGAGPFAINPFAIDVVVKSECTAVNDPERQEGCSHYDTTKVA